MPNQHALLSPSSSERWLHCPRSARLCEGMADTTSSYASEGTEAHALCEHLLLQALGRNTTDPRPQFKQYSNEMQEAAEGYVQYVMEQVADFRAQGIEPAVYVEQRLDLRAFIPDCMGTSDAIVVGGDTVIVVDFKFGCQPVPASSPQLRIYSLGVCELLSCLYDFTRVRTVIYQPRLSTVDEAEITKDDLYAWANDVLAPIAQMAYEGKGEFECGDWCRFCRARNQCRTLAEHQMALAQYDFREPPLLTDNEIASIPRTWRRCGRMANGWRYKKDNPEYDRYIHSVAWRDTANRRLDQDSHVCQVCGGDATDVHHLTYDRFGHEDMNDLVSLCRRCHEKAEALYDPAIIPWAMDEVKPEGNNFMAAMRMDAMTIAPVVFDYLKQVRGDSFDALMVLRQPDDAEGKKYWSVLKRAVDALCRKRYSRNCVADRLDIMVGAVTNRVTAICLQQIEHYIRNGIQASLHDVVMTEYAIQGKWKFVANQLGISNGTLQTLRRDDGSSFGPSLREAVLYYCGLDAAAGIPPVPGFNCLTEADYIQLNTLASYMVSVSGTGKFRGEHTCES